VELTSDKESEVESGVLRVVAALSSMLAANQRPAFLFDLQREGSSDKTERESIDRKRQLKTIRLSHLKYNSQKKIIDTEEEE
jgi:hypothetical protein